MDVRWSSQGMLRLMPDAMRQLFRPTTDQIKQAVGDVLNKPNITGKVELFKVQLSVMLISLLHMPHVHREVNLQ